MVVISIFLVLYATIPPHLWAIGGASTNRLVPGLINIMSRFPKRTLLVRPAKSFTRFYPHSLYPDFSLSSWEPMRPHFVSKSTIAILFLCVSFASAQESRQLRIVRPIDNRDVVRLQGTLHPRARSEFDQGPVSPKLPLQHMTLAFQPTAAQQAALKGLLAAQLDRSSPDYHKWLTPEEYGDRFGLNETDANTVAAGYARRDSPSKRSLAVAPGFPSAALPRRSKPHFIPQSTTT